MLKLAQLRRIAVRIDVAAQWAGGRQCRAAVDCRVGTCLRYELDSCDAAKVNGSEIDREFAKP